MSDSSAPSSPTMVPGPMPLPKKWDDKRLLRSEPFLSKFAAWELNQSRPRRGCETISNIAIAVNEDLVARSAALAWLRIAFTADTQKERPAIQAKARSVIYDKAGCELFVKVFWNLKQGDRNAAFAFLVSERASRGYGFWIPESTAETVDTVREAEVPVWTDEGPTDAQGALLKRKASTSKSQNVGAKKSRLTKNRKNLKVASAEVAGGELLAATTGPPIEGLPPPAAELDSISVDVFGAEGAKSKAKSKGSKKKKKKKKVKEMREDVNSDPSLAVSMKNDALDICAPSAARPTVGASEHIAQPPAPKPNMTKKPNLSDYTHVSDSSHVHSSATFEIMEIDPDPRGAVEGAILDAPLVQAAIARIAAVLPIMDDHTSDTELNNAPRRTTPANGAMNIPILLAGDKVRPVKSKEVRRPKVKHQATTEPPAKRQRTAKGTMSVALESGLPLPAVEISHGPMPALAMRSIYDQVAPAGSTRHASEMPTMPTSHPTAAKPKRKRASILMTPRPTLDGGTPTPRPKKRLPTSAKPRVRSQIPAQGLTGSGTVAKIVATMSSVGGAAEYLASGPPVRRQPELDLGEDESRAWEGEGLEGVHEEQACLPTPSTKGLPGRVDHPLAPSIRPRLGFRKPPIWAQSRQEVCETLHFFKSYQGGVYHLHEIVKGYLLSAFSASRDVFEHGGKLIISHGGGKSEAVHSKHGQLETHAATDQQADDQSVRALRNTRAQKRPVVLLADDKYALFPYDLAAEGYTYVVLGLYWITDAWAELQETPSGPVKRWKFAFQWCENQGEPWWCIDAQPATEVPCSSVETSEAREQGVTTIESAGYLPDLPIDASCIRCKKTSSHVYSASWICLTPDCHAFWKLDGDHSAGDDLTYEPAFLCLRPQPIKNLKESVMPAPLPTAKNGNATTQRFTKGMHCAKCGRLSSRFKWEHWECKTCQTVYQVHNQLRDPKDFWVQPRNIPFETFKMARDAGITCKARAMLPTKSGQHVDSHTFILPSPEAKGAEAGRIHLLRPRVFGNKAADEVFRLYQEQASSGEIEFRRWPLRNHKCRGQLLSNYFSQNTGAPYQYVGGSDRTVPLDACASCVRGALDLINDRVYGALNRDEPFNEVLSAAYMEKQKMAFHSDSERGLGPVVASLSLGSVAYIHFRLHARYTRDLGNRKIALTIALQHGDVLVMEGAGVQVYYEHTVVPMNFRMVATARYISPDNDTY